MSKKKHGTLTFANSLLAQSLSSAFQWFAGFVALTGASTVGAGIVLNSAWAIAVGLGIAAAGVALLVLASVLRTRHLEATKRVEG